MPRPARVITVTLYKKYSFHIPKSTELNGLDAGLDIPPNTPFPPVQRGDFGEPVPRQLVQRLSGWSPEDSSRRGDRALFSAVTKGRPPWP